MGEWIELTAADGHSLAAYENDQGGTSRAVVVVQEIFGVNAHIRDLVDRFAGLGFRAIAPALFDRIERSVELGYDMAGVARGREIRSGISTAAAMADVGAAVDHLTGTGPVGVVGYCYGGTLAHLASARLEVAAAVGYYGGQIVDHLDEEPRSPLMLHFGAIDEAIPPADVERISAAWPSVSVHVHEGAGHGFNCDQRGSYHQVAAAEAAERTIAFLEEALA